MSTSSDGNDRPSGSLAGRMRESASDLADLDPSLARLLGVAAAAVDEVAAALRSSLQRTLTESQRHHAGSLLDQLR
jgi:hypothetical protein